MLRAAVSTNNVKRALLTLFVLTLALAAPDDASEQHERIAKRGRGHRSHRAAETDASLATYSEASNNGELTKFLRNTGLFQGAQFAVKILSVVTSISSALTRHVALSITHSIWFDKASRWVRLVRNDSCREEAMSAFRDVLLATCSKTPRFINSSRVVLDSFAQFSLEVNAPPRLLYCPSFLAPTFAFSLTP